MVIINKFPYLYSSFISVDYGHLAVADNQSVFYFVLQIVLSYKVNGFSSILGCVYHLLNELWRVFQVFECHLNQNLHALKVKGLVIDNHNSLVASVYRQA
jgi:hypothetical protein